MDETDTTGVGWPSLSRRTLLQHAAVGGLLGLSSTTSTADTDTPRQAVVRLKSETGTPGGTAPAFQSRRKTAAEAAREPLHAFASGRTGIDVLQAFWLLDGALVELDPGQVHPRELQAIDGVDWLHDNHEFRLPDPHIASTTDHGDQTYGLEQVGAPAVWDRFDTRGGGASVAVIDTGVAPGHPDIDIDPANFAEFDADGNQVEGAEIRDSSYHGTHVSGTAIGSDASGRHIGVAPEATLYHGLGLPEGGGTFAQIIAALEWAVEQGVDVANLSLGAPGFIAELVEPVQNAVAAGTVVVAAAGNDGAGVVSTPGAVFESLAVGAANENREIAEFSGGRVVDTSGAWGRDAPDTWPEEYVLPDVSGPGVDVFSAFPEDADPPPGAEPVDDQWIEISGTSMAAPHVAGAVALLQSASADVPESFDADQTVRALTTTATRPDESDEPDARYGAGIVDGVAATSRVAAQSGVEGSVTDTTGDPVSQGTVTLDGFPVETEPDGSFRLRADAGTYDLRADGFGFASNQQTVEVTEGFTTVGLTLSRTLDVALRAGQPDGLEAEETFSVTFGVANVESYQVAPATEFQGSVTLLLDGEEVTPGQTVAVDEDTTAVTLTVDPSASARGDLVFEHTFSGRGETVERTTGPTAVFETFVNLAVVDRENGVFTEELAGLLRENLDPVYEVSVLTPAEALTAAQEASVAGFVVQSLGSDGDLVESFVEATAIPQLGVVYLQQSGGTGAIAEDGLAADAIYRRSEATDDPSDVVDTAIRGANPRVRYEVTDESHQIIEDADVSSPVTLYEAFPVQFLGAFHSYFEGFEGEINGRTIAEVSAGIRTEQRAGLAVDELSRTVLAASLGLSDFVGRRVFQSGAVELLTSAAEYAATAPRVSVLDDQRDRVEPGSQVELRLSVRELLEYELTLGEETTLAADDLTATLNGDPIGFGEAVDTGGLTDEVTLRVGVPETGGQQVALVHRFVTRGRRGGEETTTATTGPTAIYTPPLSVPGDTETVNEAVDIAVEGGDIVVGGRLHAEQSSEDPTVGVLVDTPGVTLRPMRGAQPSILHADDRPNPEVVRVAADGVTLDGIDLNVVDGSVDQTNANGSAVTIGGSTAGVTVRNLTAGGTFGVQIEGGATGARVENVTAVETILGVGTSSSASGTVEDAAISRVRVLARPETTFRGGIIVDSAASGVTVSDCYVQMRDGEVGIGLVGPFGGGAECEISGNTVVADDITDAGTGVSNAGVFLDEAATVVENNAIEGAYTGIQVSDLGFGEEAVVVQNNEFDTTVGVAQFGDYVTARENTIDAETGFKLGDDPDATAPTLVAANAVLARDNDLSATTVPFVGEPDDGFGTPDGPFDCRRNYLGDRGYEDQIREGAVAYDPFLTDPPGTETSAVATDCLLDPGTPSGLGIPGPTAQTVWDVLGVDGADEFLGSVQRWDQATEGFRQAEDGEITPLDGFRVTPGSGVRATIEFQDAGAETASLPRDQAFERGEHLVCAPAYGDEAVFDAGTAEIGVVEQRFLEPPRDQVGPDDGPAPETGADKSALSAYSVDVEQAGTIEPSLDATDPTMTQLLTALGLEPSVHDDPGKPPATEPSEPLPFSAVGESGDPPVRAVMAVLGRHLREAVADTENGVATPLAETLDTALSQTDDTAVVARAASRLLGQFYALAVVDADGERVPAEIRRRKSG